MENFDQIFIILTKHNGIGFNTNILETGLINIIALLTILVYTGQNFLGSVLEERRIAIITGLQDAENRLNEAQKRLTEANKQLNQANLIVSEIKSDTIATKRRLLELDVSRTKADLKIRFNRGLATFRSKERQVFLEIKQQIIDLVLQRTLNRAQETFKPKNRSTTLINETIDKLKGDLL